MDIDTEIADACRRSVRRALRLPGDIGFNRLDRRSGEGMRRGGRGLGGSRGVGRDQSLYGLQGTTAFNFMMSADGGGEAGVATGHGFIQLFRLDKLPGVNSELFARDGKAGGTPASGWRVFIGSTNQLTGRFYSGAGGAVAQTGYVFTASDVGKVFVLIGQHAGTQTRLWCSKSVSADVAITGYTAATTGTALGVDSGLQNPNSSATLVSQGNFRGVPLAADITAYFDAARSLGDLPDTIGNGTITHLWSLKRELAGTVINSGQIAPAQLTDQVTRASGDALLRNGMAVQTDANSIRAVGPFGTGSSFQTAVGGGIQGANAGFYATIDYWPVAVPTGTERWAHCTNTGISTGWRFDASASALNFKLCGGVATSPTYTLTSGDLGKRLRVLLHKTASVIQLWVNGVQIGADVAAAAYTANPANTIAMVFGALSDGSQAMNSAYFEAFSGGASSLTGAEIAAQFADMTQPPPVVAGKTTKRYIAELDIAAGAGAMPTALLERVSGGDSMLRFGGPVTVTKIDPTTDGRRTLGAQNLSPTNYLLAATALRGSATSFWFSFYGKADAITTTAVRRFLDNTGASSGYRLYATAAGAMNVGTLASGTLANAATSYTLTAADLVRPLHVVASYAGGVLSFWVNRVLISSQAATFVAGTSPMRIGAAPDGSVGCEQVGVFGVAGSDSSALSTAQILAHFDAVAASGRMQSVVGQTEHLYDLTTDVLAGGVEAVPATVLDRVGTDNLTRVGIDVRTDANAIRSVGPYGAADGWQTALGGGIQGANAFHVVADVWLIKVPTANEIIVMATPSSGTTGWFIQVTSAGALRIVLGAGTQIASSTYQLTAADLNKRLRIVANKTTSVVQLFVQGVQAGADVAAATYNVNTNVAMAIGQFFGAQNFSSGYVELIEGGSSSLTTPEIAAVNADLTAAAPSVSGKTQKRYVFEQDIAAASGSLTALSVERVSGGDSMARLGAPLTLAQRTERVWSYETAPISSGVNGMSSTAFYSNAGGFTGDSSGWGFLWVGSIDSQGVASATRVLVGKRDATNPGFQLVTLGTNSAFQLTVGSSSGSASTTTAAIASTELGKTFVIGCWYDGSKARLMVRRLEVGTGASLTGVYAASSAAFVVGKRSDSLPADGITFRGFVGLAGVPALAELQAAHDAILAREEIASVPTRSVALYDVGKDSTIGAVPAVITDRIGSAPLAQSGAPTQSLNYTRAAA
jgi:hypothetical protein